MSNSPKIYDEGWCIVDTTVRPVLASLFKKVIKFNAVVESSPVVGSSKNIIEGFVSSYKPIEVLFFYPPEIPRILLSPT